MILVTEQGLTYPIKQTIINITPETKAIVWQGIKPIIGKQIVKRKGVQIWGCPNVQVRLSDKSFLESLTGASLNERQAVEVICGQVYRNGKPCSKPYLIINFKAVGADNLGEVRDYQDVIMYNCKHKEHYITEKIHRKFKLMLKEAEFSGAFQTSVSFSLASGMALVSATTDPGELYPLVFRNYSYKFLYDGSRPVGNYTIVIGLRVSVPDRRVQDTLVVGAGKNMAEALSEAKAKFNEIDLPEKYARVTNITEDLAKVQNEMGRIL